MTYEENSEFDRQLMEKAAGLAKGVSPERDLWPDIQASIDAPAVSQNLAEKSIWNSVWAQAAAVLLLVGGSSGITYLAMSGGGADVTSPVGNGQSLVFEPVSGSFGSDYNLGPSYQDARHDLAAELEEKIAELAPEARTEVLLNIDAIRTAIADINKALAKEPDNVLLQEMLLRTYRDELSLMTKVDVITRSSMRREDI